MAKNPVKDKEPIMWDCLDWSYRETGTEGASLHSRGGLFVSTMKTKIIISVLIIIFIALWVFLESTYITPEMQRGIALLVSLLVIFFGVGGLAIFITNSI